MKTMLADSGQSADAMKTMVGGGDGPSSAPDPTPMVPASNAAMETMQADPNQSFSAMVAAGPATPQAAPRRKVALSSTDVNEQGARLEYVCQLLKKARLPGMPQSMGMLALVPFELVEPARDELQSAAQRDLSLLSDSLGMRCSLTVLVNENGLTSWFSVNWSAVLVWTMPSGNGLEKDVISGAPRPFNG